MKGNRSVELFAWILLSLLLSFILSPAHASTHIQNKVLLSSPKSLAPLFSYSVPCTAVYPFTCCYVLFLSLFLSFTSKCCCPNTDGTHAYTQFIPSSHVLFLALSHNPVPPFCCAPPTKVGGHRIQPSPKPNPFTYRHKKHYNGLLSRRRSPQGGTGNHCRPCRPSVSGSGSRSSPHACFPSSCPSPAATTTTSSLVAATGTIACVPLLVVAAVTGTGTGAGGEGEVEEGLGVAGLGFQCSSSQQPFPSPLIARVQSVCVCVLCVVGGCGCWRDWYQYFD